jgi:hypothetical protein
MSRQAYQRPSLPPDRDVTIRTSCHKTQRDHIRHIEAFASFPGRPLGAATGDDIRCFLFANRPFTVTLFVESYHRFHSVRMPTFNMN